MFILIIIAVCFIVYWPCLRNGLAGDDQAVLKDESVQQGNWKQILGRWRWPIRLPLLVTYALNFKYARGTTTLFHVSDVSIHSICSILVYWFLHLIGFDELAAQVGALVFATHPLTVNAVANIAGRSATLSGMFGLIGAIAAITGMWPFALLMWLMAFLCKQDAATLPVLYAALAYLNGEVWWPFLVIPLGILGWQWKRVRQMATAVGMSTTTGFNQPLKPLEFAQTFFVESVKRMPRWFIGVGNSINPSVPMATTSALSTAIVVFTLFITLSVVFGSTVWLTMVAFLCLGPWTFYCMKPLADVILEHRAYMNVVAFSILAGLLTSIIPIAWLLLWMFFLAFRTIRRSAMWDTFIVWEQAIRDGSTKPLVLLNWSSVLIKAGRLDEAEKVIRMALDEAPRVMHGWINLGQIHGLRGQVVAMHHCLLKAVKYNGRNSNAWEVLRSFYLQTKRPARVAVCERRMKELV